MLKEAIIAHWSHSATLGAQARTVASLLTSGLAETTWVVYASHIRSFLSFLAQSDVTLDITNVTAGLVARFIAWLYDKGMSGSSIDQRVSALSSVLRRLGLPSPVDADLVVLLRRAIKRRPNVGIRRVRPKLPADAALRVWQRGISLFRADGSVPPAHATSLREVAAVTMAYVIMGRSMSVTGLRHVACLVDPVVGSLTVAFPIKGGDYKAMDWTVVLPPTAVTDFLVRYIRWHSRSYPAEAFVFRFPGDPPRLSSTHVSGWLRNQLVALGIHAPDGFAFSSHSLRGGAASAAFAIGVPERRIQAVGGWGSAQAMQPYIDAAVAPSDAARCFFGHLVT